MLCSALNLAPQEQPALSADESAATVREIAAQNGFALPEPILTREEAAKVLYQANQFLMK